MTRSQLFIKQTKKLGILGEQVAADYLQKKGYRIIDRNYRCRNGEIDLVAEQSEYLVFVEVKSRYDGKSNINPLISMTKAKCNRLRLLGKIYLAKNDFRKKQPRFDVIGIKFRDEKDYTIEHIENAF